MSSYNKVILMGNLTRDPELRFTQSNMAICKIGLAVNRRFKDSQTGEWREEPTFVDITIFGKRGEAFAKFHSKGKPAFIEGELRFDTWEDQNGQKRSKLYVVADSWEFIGGAREAGGGGGGNYGGQQSGGSPQAAPQGEQQGEQQGAQQGAQQGGGDYSRQPQGGGYGEAQPGYLEVDDTPF